MQIDVSRTRPATAPFAVALARTFLGALVVGVPLAALMLTPGLMRSRAELFSGASALGITLFVLLSALLIIAGPTLSAWLSPLPGWGASTARRVSRALRRERPGQWWRRLGEAAVLFVAAQLVGGAVAWAFPYIWRNETDSAWVLSYPNYALQAVSMYLVIAFAAAWFGTRIRGMVRGVELVDGQPLSA